jgi:hypothetical protein
VTGDLEVLRPGGTHAKRIEQLAVLRPLVIAGIEQVLRLEVEDLTVDPVPISAFGVLSLLIPAG